MDFPAYGAVVAAQALPVGPHGLPTSATGLLGPLGGLPIPGGSYPALPGGGGVGMLPQATGFEGFQPGDFLLDLKSRQPKQCKQQDSSKASQQRYRWASSSPLR